MSWHPLRNLDASARSCLKLEKGPGLACPDYYAVVVTGTPITGSKSKDAGGRARMAAVRSEITNRSGGDFIRTTWLMQTHGH
jgi:hypothetical protein